MKENSVYSLLLFANNLGKWALLTSVREPRMTVKVSREHSLWEGKWQGCGLPCRSPSSNPTPSAQPPPFRGGESPSEGTRCPSPAPGPLLGVPNGPQSPSPSAPPAPALLVQPYPNVQALTPPTPGPTPSCTTPHAAIADPSCHFFICLVFHHLSLTHLQTLSKKCSSPRQEVTPLSFFSETSLLGCAIFLLQSGPMTFLDLCPPRWLSIFHNQHFTLLPVFKFLYYFPSFCFPWVYSILILTSCIGH